MKRINLLVLMLLGVLSVWGQSKIRRSQEPQAPYPYQSEDVVFENKSANIKLAGTFTYPENSSDFPAVVLITGSGAQDRNEEIAGHKPFFVIADHLTQNGIAVLRFDDRGVGKSEGDFSKATTRDLATDAKAAFDYLKTKSGVNTDKIGLLGHSEGGTIAFMLAANNKDIAYIISLAGGAIKGDSLLYMQRRMIADANATSSIVFKNNEDIVKKMGEIVNQYSPDTIIQNADKFINPLLPPYMRGNAELRKQMSAQLAAYASPWMQYYLKYDPTSDLNKIQCPVFALNGDVDVQVNADANLGAIKKYVKGKVTTKKYIDLNHLFQYSKTGFGLPEEYESLDETISTKVLDDISDWILKTTK